MGTGTNLSTIYAVKFGQSTSVMGVGIAFERVGEPETKDATLLPE